MIGFVANSARAFLVLSLGLGALGACAAGGESTQLGLGFQGASSEDFRPGEMAIDTGDLDAVVARGRMLFRRQQVMALGYEKVVARLGTLPADPLIAIATVDEGGHSGDLTFYRWREDGEGPLDPSSARRWLVAPMLLRPDRVLELEQFSDRVEPNSPIYHHLRAIDGAMRGAREKHPAGGWRVHGVRERLPGGPGQWQTRVYLFAEVGSGAPDLEVVVRDVRSRQTPELGAWIVHHRAETLTAKGALRSERPQPGVMSVARALAGVMEEGRIWLEGSDGSRWELTREGTKLEPAATPKAAEE